MSVQGQKAKYSLRVNIFRFTPETGDIARYGWDVGFVPITEVAVSFDRRVGTGEQRRWDFDTQRFGSLEVDD
jgi:hypothetical protein